MPGSPPGEMSLALYAPNTRIHAPNINRRSRIGRKINQKIVTMLGNDGLAHPVNSSSHSRLRERVYSNNSASMALLHRSARGCDGGVKRGFGWLKALVRAVPRSASHCSPQALNAPSIIDRKAPCVRRPPSTLPPPLRARPAAPPPRSRTAPVCVRKTRTPERCKPRRARP